MGARGKQLRDDWRNERNGLLRHALPFAASPGLRKGDGVILYAAGEGIVFAVAKVTSHPCLDESDSTNWPWRVNVEPEHAREFLHDGESLDVLNAQERDPALIPAIERFQAPKGTTGDAAAIWLAVLILWLARAVGAEIGGETIFRHAVGIAQIGSRRVGAAVIAVDPFDATAENYWRTRFGFRASLTKTRDGSGAQQSRLWLPLFPD
jgi:hypothetical protein